jgi:Cytochrome c554 and c-prime
MPRHAAFTVVVLTCLLSGCGEAARSRTSAKTDPPQVSSSTGPVALVGSPSCAGRSCHGSAAPEKFPENPSRYSFSLWQEKDPHARAYDILNGPLAKEMERALKPLGITNVAEEPRCLVCHTNPRATDKSNPVARQEWLFGTGCESCHGSAGEWLVPHREAAWQKLQPPERQKKYDSVHMTYLQSLPVRAETCAGCHVGAPADKEKGIPARDVNHDFIAAGHPRLMFEFSAFLANLPMHWVERPEIATKSFPARVWAVGQPASAKAALDLLFDSRLVSSDPQKPVEFTELAEFDCYACHQPLRNEDWRTKERRDRGLLGGIQPSAWYTTLIPVLSETVGKKKLVIDSIPGVLAIEGPLTPDLLGPQRNKAKANRAELNALLSKVDVDFTKDEVTKLRIALAKSGTERKYSDWDETEQTALGLVALHAAEKAFRGGAAASEREKEIEAAIEALVKKLAFPPEANSPKSYRRSLQQDKERLELFEKLAKP